MKRLFVLMTAGCALSGVWAGTVAKAEILESKVICREPGRYLGWPTICRRSNGELLVVFSGDRDAHVCPWGKVQLIRSTDDGRTWSDPVTIQNGIIDDRDAGIVELKDGTLVLNWFTSIAFYTCYKEKMGGERRDQYVEYRRHYEVLPREGVRAALGAWTSRSTDGGRTWSKPVRSNGQLPHAFTPLKDGRLVGVTRKMSDEGQMLEDEPGFKDVGHHILFEESKDGGRSWRLVTELEPAEGVQLKDLHEPHLAELPDGRLVAQVRWHGSARVGTRGSIVQAESSDGGKTWTKMKPTGIVGLPPHLLTLADGRLLTVYGNRNKDVWGEYACLSEDGGRTWDLGHEIKLASCANGDLGYPASVQLGDGTILTVYYQQAPGDDTTSIHATRWRLPARRGAWPFAILRSYGAYSENKLFTERVFAAQERHPGLFEEIWFGGCGGPDSTAEERGKMAAEKNAGMRERCHRLGIAFSYQQGVTLNHGPDGVKRDFVPEDAWAVDRNGNVAYGMFCCTSPWALDYQRETAKAVMGRLQPDSYWPDDDLRLSKGNWGGSADFCFCDRCLKLFGESYGKAFTRVELNEALNGEKPSAAVRKAWSAFNGKNLGACAKVYREAADAVSPKTRLGIQIALSGNTLDGDSWKTIIQNLAGNAGRAGTRPGGLYYTDFNPHQLPEKIIRVAREAARSGDLPETAQTCYEIENWPHVGGHKNPHAMMAECAWSLAAGCDSIAFYWGADQNGEDDASYDYWLESVWDWRPFHLAVRDAFAGTKLAGVAAYHGDAFWATKRWMNHEEGEAGDLVACGVPVTVTEAAPDALWLNEACVETLAESDLKDVFSKPAIMSAAAFVALAKRFPKLAFAKKLDVVFPGSERALATAKRENGYELFPSGRKSANVKAFIVPNAADVKAFSEMTAFKGACGTCVVPTEFGGKVVVAQEVPSHWPHAVWAGCRRHAILDALDEAVPGGMPARLLTDGYAVAVVARKDESGRTAGVFLFNLGLGETPPMEVAIRRGAAKAWRVSLGRRAPVAAEVVRQNGGETVVRVPPIGAYDALLVAP